MGIKVYLDTNIIIQGEKVPEHAILRDMAREDEVRLFISTDVLSEQQRRSFKRFFETNTVGVREMQELERAEESEWRFWSFCDIEQVRSTFGGLQLLGVLSKADILEAVENDKRLLMEVLQLESLLSKHRLGGKDALQTMHAHGAGCDYLLTWDEKKFIDKCQSISWLNCRVTDPLSFIKKL